MGESSHYGVCKASVILFVRLGDVISELKITCKVLRLLQ